MPSGSGRSGAAWLRARCGSRSTTIRWRWFQIATCHLTCRACGRVVAVDGTEILDWGKQVAAEAGYIFTGYAAALSGLCPAHAG
jgi:Fe2+ or Zn2+ uptake regulation protein